MTQEMFDNWMEYGYKDSLPFPPEYSYMFGKDKHNCEERRALGVSKLDGISSMTVRDPYRLHIPAQCDLNRGSVHEVQMIPVSYLTSKNSFRIVG